MTEHTTHDDDRVPILFGKSPEVVDAAPVGLSRNPGNPKTVALALDDHKHMPIDAMGFPVGQETPRVGKAIKRPFELTQVEWLTAIEVAVEHFRFTQGLVRPTKELLSAMSEMPKRVWDTIYDDEQNLKSFESALALKGILRKGAGLTYDQMRCLRYLTDVTVRGSLETRLKHLGVTWERFQNWQRDPRFNEQFKAISEDVLEQAQPLVMMELTRNSVKGNLESIKYFHQITGRYDGAVSGADLEAFFNGLVEILQYEISDTDTLRRIGAKLSTLRKETLAHRRDS